MGDNKGTKQFDDSLEGSSTWYDLEAVCVDDIDTIEELFDGSTDSNISDLLNDVDDVDQGNPLALYNELITKDCDRAVTALKRKLLKSPQQPVAVDLSPQLAACTISPSRNIKRRLFEDSGVELDDEAVHLNEKVDVTVSADNSQESSSQVPTSDTTDIQILKSSNVKATQLAIFKQHYGVSYTELTRVFKSNKTCSSHWVVCVFKTSPDMVEASKTVLKQYVQYVQIIEDGVMALYLISFNAMKSRDTVINIFCKLLNCNCNLIIADPPKMRSTAAALYWYRRSLGNNSFTFGSMPDWMAQQTLVEHQLESAAETFELAKMIQWAYDNDKTTESEIAYNYALIADEDSNAAAFLKSNNQYRYVKDAAAMVRMYKRQEMLNMSMSEWIFKCCDECEQSTDWKVIARFLSYQGINTTSFLIALRIFLKRIPKKNVILFHGPPDTGKSYFANSLVSFLKGKVVSIVNRNSHFWLSPLMDTKIGLIDDITYPAWEYFDVNLRNGLDGNPVCIDAKHRQPQQIKLPPLLMTSNVDVHAESGLKYLHSRITSFKFPNKLPVDENDQLIYNITHATWNCFFRKLALQLDITEKEDDGSGRTDKALRCCARTANDSY